MYVDRLGRLLRYWLRQPLAVGCVACSVVVLAACADGVRPGLDGQPRPADAVEAEFDSEQAESGSATTSEVDAASELPALDQDLRGETLSPPADGVRAVITSTGVLAPLIGETPTRKQIITPCGNEAFVEWGHPVTEVQVLLDPGHGGSESGADDAPELLESDLNLQIARRVSTQLLERGISVAVTRTGDYRMPVKQRTDLADYLQVDAFVSIHHNTPASRRSTTPGSEVYVQSTSTDSTRLGGLIYEEVFDALSQFKIEWSSRDDAGVLVVLDDEGEDAYGIVRRPAVPTTLVELAYLGNPNEVALMATEAYVDAASTAVADGIERYLTTTDPGSGFIETPRVYNPSNRTGGGADCVDPRLD